MTLHNQIMLGGVWSLTFHVAYFHKLSSCDEAYGPLESGILLCALVHRRCVLHREYMVLGYILPHAERSQTGPAKRLANFLDDPTCKQTSICGIE